MAKKYRVLVDAIVEGQTFVAGTEIPDGSRLTVFPDDRAEPYVSAGLIEEIAPEEPGKVDPTMLPNPPNPYDGSANNSIDGDGNVILNGNAPDAGNGNDNGGSNGSGAANTSGVIDPEKHSKPELIAIAKDTPNCVFNENDTKAEIAKAINDAVATNAADAARNGGNNPA